MASASPSRAAGADGGNGTDPPRRSPRPPGIIERLARSGKVESLWPTHPCLKPAVPGVPPVDLRHAVNEGQPERRRTETEELGREDEARSGRLQREAPRQSSRRCFRPLRARRHDHKATSPLACLIASVRALLGLGDLFVAAPASPQSSMGRAFGIGPGRGVISEVSLEVDGSQVPAYSVTGPPALVVAHALTELTPTAGPVRQRDKPRREPREGPPGERHGRRSLRGRGIRSPGDRRVAGHAGSYTAKRRLGRRRLGHGRGCHQAGRRQGAFLRTAGSGDFA